jgi:hypothetical protein
LSAMAFALIRMSKRLRGQMSYSDALFPFALLNWGHWFSFLWWWHINFILPVAVLVVLFRIVLGNPTQLTVRDAVLAGACLVLLPLTGPAGLAYVPAVAFWLAYSVVTPPGFLPGFRPAVLLEKRASEALWSHHRLLGLPPLALVGASSQAQHLIDVEYGRGRPFPHPSLLFRP